MKVIITVGISAIGAYYGRTDFFMLYSLISMALDLVISWTNYTNDKHSDKMQK